MIIIIWMHLQVHPFFCLHYGVYINKKATQFLEWLCSRKYRNVEPME